MVEQYIQRAIWMASKIACDVEFLPDAFFFCVGSTIMGMEAHWPQDSASIEMLQKRSKHVTLDCKLMSPRQV
jgi:hypothetical protein